MGNVFIMKHAMDDRGTAFEILGPTTVSQNFTNFSPQTAKNSTRVFAIVFFDDFET